VEVAESATHSGNVVARLEGCDDRDAALEYQGLEIAVPRTALPKAKKGEVYQADMIGLEVRNRENEVLGKIASLFSNGAHEVLRITREDGSEQLIPMVPAVLDEIDLEAGTVRVDWGSDW
jgi:16S rRNA processing protein RimM